MDIASMVVADIVRVGAALVAGALIGLERELRDKSAGFRTMIFICVGSAVFTILSENLAGDGDRSRIAAYVVSGIGFLGAGAILRDGLRVAGLTTAATIWLTAAIGMTMGGGQFLFGALITFAALLVLWMFPPLEHAIDRIMEENIYEVVIPVDLNKLDAIQSALKQMKLKVLFHRHYKKGGEMICKWGLLGLPQAHEKFINYLVADTDVKEFTY